MSVSCKGAFTGRSRDQYEENEWTFCPFSFGSQLPPYDFTGTISSSHTGTTAVSEAAAHNSPFSSDCKTINNPLKAWEGENKLCVGSGRLVGQLSTIYIANFRWIKWQVIARNHTGHQKGDDGNLKPVGFI